MQKGKILFTFSSRMEANHKAVSIETALYINSFRHPLVKRIRHDGRVSSLTAFLILTE